MTQRYWIIKGYDGETKILEKMVKLGLFTERQIAVLLKTLAAQTLDVDEIIGALARRNCSISNDLLEVQRDGPFPRFRCGENPHFSAHTEPYDYDVRRITNSK